MADIYVKNGSGSPNTGTYRGLWVNSTTWAVGDRVAPSLGYTPAASRGRIYECTTAGAGGATEPTWVNTVGNTTTSGAAVFTCRAASTWADALIDLAGAAANDAAGDRIFVDSTHSETQSAAQTYAWAGSVASPVQIVSVTAGSEPPSSVSAGAQISVSGAINQTGTAIYWEGLTLTVTGTTNLTLQTQSATGGARALAKDCSFRMASTGSGSRISFGGSNGVLSEWRNCTVRFANAGQAINANNGVYFRWSGGGVLSGGTSPTTLFSIGTPGTRVLLEGVDLSELSSTVNIFSFGGSAGIRGILRHCKLPSGWTGSLASGSAQVNERYEMHNCDSGDTNYRMAIADYCGTIREDTVIYRTGGASDGDTPLAWRMVASTSTEYPVHALETPDIVRAFPGTAAEESAWTPGASVTVSVEVLSFSTTAVDNTLIELEVEYLGTSGLPISTIVRSGPALLTTPTTLTSSTEEWNAAPRQSSTAYAVGDVFEAQGKVFAIGLGGAGTTAAIEPAGYVTATDGDTVIDGTATARCGRRYVLSHTITPQEKGIIRATVKCYDPGRTVLVCPKLTVT